MTVIGCTAFFLAGLLIGLTAGIRWAVRREQDTYARGHFISRMMGMKQGVDLTLLMVHKLHGIEAVRELARLAEEEMRTEGRSN